MASKYDEDLTQNDFFKEISQNHRNLLKKSSEEKWIICIPRKGTIKSKDICSNIILDHILLQQKNNTFATLSCNKEEIHLENSHLSCRNFLEDIQILFVETHYIQEYQKCIIWCVDKPFFMQINHQQQAIGHREKIPFVNLPPNLNTVHDCLDFLIAKNSKIVKGIQLLCTNFWYKTEDTFEIKDLQCQKDLIGNLYSQCLQLCFECDFSCDKNSIDLHNIKLAVESCMQYFLGEKLMYSINSLVGVSDSEFNKIVRNSMDVSLGDLNISNQLDDLIFRAKYEMLKINSFFTILDKMNCLRNIFKLFTNKCCSSDGKPSVFTSDDILQIFVCLLLKCSIPNCIGNLIYLKELNFSSLEYSDQNSFLITTLEGAIEFIKSFQYSDIRKSISYESNINNNDVKFIRVYTELKQGNYNNILSVSSASATVCHPLCSCNKCVSQEKPILSEILNESNQNLLIFSCIQGDIELVTFLLTLDFPINFQDNFGKTALHYSAEKGFQKILLLLISYDANVNILDSDKNTSLHLASDRGHENCVKALIYSSHLVEVNLQNYAGETALFLATKWGYFDIIKFLLENGASVCLKNNRNLGVLKLATNIYVSKLFEQFGTVQSTNILKELKTPEIQQIESTSASTSNFYSLPTAKIDGDHHQYGVQTRNVQEFNFVNLLLKSIERNDLQLTFYYLGYNLSADVKEHYHHQYYSNSVLKKCHPLCNCKQCTSAKMNQNSSSDDNDNDNAIATATARRNCNHRLNVNFCNADGYTPLHVAAKFGRTQILRKLLDSGASVNARTYHKLYAPLHLAVIYQKIDTFKELLQCGSCLNINAEDYRGNTPLYYASIKNSDLKMCELLLYNGANFQKKNSYIHKTIYQECKEKCLVEICKLFKENLS